MNTVAMIVNTREPNERIVKHMVKRRMKNAVIDELRPFLIKTAMSMPVTTPSSPSVTKNRMLNNYFDDSKKASGIRIMSATMLNVSGTKAAMQK